MADLTFDDIAILADKDNKWTDVVDAARAAGRADKGVTNARARMAAAIEAHGKDDAVARAALICAYASSRTGVPLAKVLEAFPKGADKTEALKKAFATGKTYYNRALKDAGLKSEGPGAGNNNAANDEETSTAQGTTVTDVTDEPKGFKTPAEVDKYATDAVATIIATLKKNGVNTRPGIMAALVECDERIRKVLNDAHALEAQAKK